MSQSQSIEVECHVVSDDDGYTLKRYIQGEPRMYGEARFEFRPVRPTLRARVIDAKRGLSEEQSTVALAKACAGRIVKWNLKDLKGNPLEITPVAFADVHPTLMQRIVGIVIYSSEGGDIDPLVERQGEQIGDIPDLLGDEKDAKAGVVDREQKNS